MHFLSGLSEVFCLVNDILIYGRSKEDHDKNLTTALERIAAAGLTLNCEKCEFAQTRVKFLGQVVDEMSIRPDPDKVNSIRRMQQPSNITELHQFLSMVNQLSKFSPQLPEKTKPL